MKFLFLSFFFISLTASANSCPPKVFISIECAPNHKDFQLLKHLGKYTHPKMDFDKSQNVMVCSYGSREWVSKYRYSHNNNQKYVSVSNLEDLAGIVLLINSKGFKVDHFGSNSNPFSMLTFKEKNNQLTADQIFLFSGLESTFENNSFSVNALKKHMVSTIVINERYLKSQNAAADTFETGSNCLVAVK